MNTLSLTSSLFVILIVLIGCFIHTACLSFSITTSRNSISEKNIILTRSRTTTTTTTTTTTMLYSKSNNDNNDNNEISNQQDKEKNLTSIRFLGKGERALIRPGCVLVAPSHEYSHWLMKSVIFIHAIGIDEYGDHVTRGVIIDHPTAFTMGEMGNVYGTLAHNLLFRGGDAGNDSAILLHSYGHGDTYTDGDDNNHNNDNDTKINCGEMIGTSGIYEGGLNDAMDLADEGLVDSERFKFFFNYVQFSDEELKNILKEVDTDGDAWASFEVPSRFVLDNDYDRGDAWSYLRNQMKQMKI